MLSCKIKKLFMYCLITTLYGSSMLYSLQQLIKLRQHYRRAQSMCNALLPGMHYCTFHCALNSESVLGIHACMSSLRLQSRPGPCNKQGISEGGQLGNCCTPTNEKGIIMQTEKAQE